MKTIRPIGFIKGELWKAIPGHEDRYFVSNFGRVKNINTKNLMKLSLTHEGYYQFDLRTYKKPRKRLSIGRTILLAFNPIKNPHLYHANHINWNPSDNRLENLEWKLASENMSRGAKRSFYFDTKSFTTLTDLLKLYTDEDLNNILLKIKNNHKS